MIPLTFFRVLPLLAAMLMIASDAAGEALTPFKCCTLTPSEWADGDRFLIRTKDGASHTIRLYGADCLEWHVADETDARRLRAQRRYFGLSEFGGMPHLSILEQATASSKFQPGTRINPNTAARDELMRLPGIGEFTANGSLKLALSRS